ncbi:hypothetical protein N8561_01395 [bacterium]|nr:hypothetical protein [bacterium]
MKNKIIEAIKKINPNAEVSVTEEDINSITWENGTQPIPVADIQAQLPTVEAETAQAAAELAYDNFDDRYLGPKASDPTLDNDGDALLDGALYFNTTTNVIKYYDGSAWSPVEAVDTSNLATNGFAIAMAIAL